VTTAPDDTPGLTSPMLVQTDAGAGPTARNPEVGQAPPATGEAARRHAQRWRAAIDTNDTKTLTRLLPTLGGDIDQPGRDGKTALMAAAAGGDPDLLRRLLRAGAEVNAANHKQATALLYAAWRGDTAIVATLLAQGADVRRRASNGWSALTMAAAKGHRQAARLLLAAAAEVDVRDVYGWTPLMRAADLGRDALVALLAGPGGADIHAINANGQTALHLAAAAGNASTFRLLRRLGGDLDRADFAGRTPRAIAIVQRIDPD